MELKEFMLKFSPYGDEEFLLEGGSKSRGFNVKDFPKALQNFADKVCELQRKECASHAETKVEKCYSIGGGYFVVDEDTILNAPMPELKTE